MRHGEADSRMVSGRFLRQLGDVLVPMPAGGQEVGVDDDSIRALGDAAGKRLSNRWFGQLHVGWLDNSEVARLTKLLDDLQQQIIAFGPSRAVIDDDDAKLRVVVCGFTHRTVSIC